MGTTVPWLNKLPDTGVMAPPAAGFAAVMIWYCGKFTMSVKLWTAPDEMPLLAVIVMGNEPVAAVVPANVPVPLPLSVNVMPLGNEPDSMSADVG